MRMFVFIFVCFVLVCPCFGRTITVDDDGPSDFNDIQAAIDDANNGDTVIVAEGTYNEDINFNGKNITVRSADPNDEDAVAGTIIDGTQSVVKFSGSETSSCKLSGFTITGGSGSPLPSPAASGGGVHGNGTQATITKCVIKDNNISTAGGSGAGLYYCDGLIKDCKIIYNNSNSDGGGIAHCNGTIINCTISHNSAEDSGGGLFKCDGTIINCTVTYNSAAGSLGGGGMDDCDGTISNCIVSGNRVSFDWPSTVGGGILDCGGTISNCKITGNSAQYGGGMYNINSEPDVFNCTFSGNLARERGGGIGSNENPNPKLTNCIIWGNSDSNGTDESSQIYSGNPDVNYSCVQGWTGSLGGTGNIGADPCFISPGYWDANGTPSDANDDFWVGGDYHLQSAAGRWDANSESWVKDANTSVAIDAGDPNSDWRGELWPHGKRINMGAYGGTAEASMSLSSAGNIANLNNDANDIVDYNDLALFVDKWLYDEVLLAEDLDRDGDVDAVDFSILAKNWLSGQ